MDSEQFIRRFLGEKVTTNHLKFYQSAILLDHKGKIIHVSHNHKHITGFMPSEVIGTRLIDRIHTIDLPHIHDLHHHMIKTGENVEAKFEVRFKDGLYYTVRSLVIPQYDDQGDFWGCLMMGRKRNADIGYIPIEKYRKTHKLSILPFSIAI